MRKEELKITVDEAGGIKFEVASGPGGKGCTDMIEAMAKGLSSEIEVEKKDAYYRPGITASVAAKLHK